jgi:hypothetical protein
MDSARLIEEANRAGFALQIAIAHIIEQTVKNHGWRVLYKEHAWKNSPDDDEGFLDLVLRNNVDKCVFAVECKRVLDSTWTFTTAKLKVCVVEPK